MTPERGFSEQWLRQVWRDQLFDQRGLCSSDGAPLRVLYPGRSNTDAGPDFRDARIRIGNTLYRGDVELHRYPSAWTSHGHHHDPRYNSVILHVVFEIGTPRSIQTVSGRSVPLLVLSPLLRPGQGNRSAPGPGIHESRRLPCGGTSSTIPVTMLARSLTRLAEIRLENRLQALAERLAQIEEEISFPSRSSSLSARAAGCFLPGAWDQLVYESVMEGLGYAKNRMSFLALARALPLRHLVRFGLSDSLTMSALLFGTAGLLPPVRSITDGESRHLVRTLKSRWNTLQQLVPVRTLDETDWYFFRLRPANFPTARLATMVFLLPRLFSGDYLARFESTLLGSALRTRGRRRPFLRFLDFLPDTYWRRHLDFGPPSPAGIALGSCRRSDILVNTLFPVTLLRAHSGGNRCLEDAVRRHYVSFPPCQQNAITRIVSRDLLRGRTTLRTSLLQQGALQLFRAYCARGACAKCPLGMSGPGGSGS